MHDGIIGWAVDAVVKRPHLLLLPAAVWLAIGVVLLLGRRNRAFGLAGGVSVASAIAWLALWLVNLDSAARDTESAHLIGLHLELLAMVWFGVPVALVVLVSVVAGLVAVATR